MVNLLRLRARAVSPESSCVPWCLSRKMLLEALDFRPARGASIGGPERGRDQSRLILRRCLEMAVRSRNLLLEGHQRLAGAGVETSQSPILLSSFPRRRESRSDRGGVVLFDRDSRLRGNDGSRGAGFLHEIESGNTEISFRTRPVKYLSWTFWIPTFAGMTEKGRRYSLIGTAGIIAGVRAGSPRSQAFCALHAHAGEDAGAPRIPSHA